MGLFGRKRQPFVSKIELHRRQPVRGHCISPL
jgi:hypothetical protein